MSQLIDRVGLAAKGSRWYLIADTGAGLRTFRVDRMTSVVPTGERVVRPEGFELAQAWQLISDEIELRRSPFMARALVDPRHAGHLRWVLDSRVRIGPAGPDGRVEVEVRGHDLDSLAAELAGFGGAVEVIDPPQLRARLRQLGAELIARYR